MEEKIKKTEGPRTLFWFTFGALTCYRHHGKFSKYVIEEESDTMFFGKRVPIDRNGEAIPGDYEAFRFSFEKKYVGVVRPCSGNESTFIVVVLDDDFNSALKKAKESIRNAYLALADNIILEDDQQKWNCFSSFQEAKE